MSTRHNHLRSIVGTVILLAACTTPVIPLPPPEINNMGFTIDTAAMPNEATFTYALPDLDLGGARVFVENDTQGTGVITTANADGSVNQTRPFTGNAGDRIVVTFDVGGEISAICVILRDGQLNAGDRCP